MSGSTQLQFQKSTLSRYSPKSPRDLQSVGGLQPSSSISSISSEDIDNLRLHESLVEEEQILVQENLVSHLQNQRDHAHQQQKRIWQTVRSQIQSLNQANALVGEMQKLKHQDSNEQRELNHMDSITEKHKEVASLRLERKARERHLRERRQEQTIANSKMIEQRRQEQQEKLRLAHELVQQGRSRSYADVKRQRGQIKQTLRTMKKSEHFLKYQDACKTRQDRKLVTRTKHLEVAAQKVESRTQEQGTRMKNFSNVARSSADRVKSLEEEKGSARAQVQIASFQRQASLDALLADPRTERHAWLMSRKSTGCLVTAPLSESLSTNRQSTATLSQGNNTSLEEPPVPRLRINAPPRTQSLDPRSLHRQGKGYPLNDDTDISIDASCHSASPRDVLSEDHIIVMI
eukprot:gnl/MRDRNA2_/MRDRNA2_62028_c0_seq1.p1 gnl/MRDRNA2_/MRDRNA2_62028_c0~~gnl/MRDRNA2_/MRDRNA2_62028_c0_seq1.p1  ORF type:complete len:404 (+),score=61.79 gnl/MRDRNA2_/MRDRNA2_62028_c0_seq1:140-1351(+)